MGKKNLEKHVKVPIKNSPQLTRMCMLLSLRIGNYVAWTPLYEYLSRLFFFSTIVTVRL